VTHIPIGHLIERVRDRGKSYREVKTVYSVSNTLGLVKAEDFRNNTIHSEDTSNYTVVRPGVFAYNPARLNIGSLAFLQNETPGLVSPMYVVFSVNENIVLKEYLNYFLKTSYCLKKINSLTEEGARFRFDFERWDLIDIPVPRLEVQSKIIHILNTFTELIAELTGELTARKKQYNYYRDQLLKFHMGGVEWKALGEIGEFIRGRRFTKADYVKDGISCIHYGDIYTQYGTAIKNVKTYVRADMRNTLRFARCGDVVITDVGETVDDVGKPVAWLGSQEVAIHDHCYAFRHSLNPTFVSYCMQTTSFIAEKAKYVARTKVNTLLMKGFAKIRIPVPSFEEQTRIVSILDKFDALSNSPTEGLSREIELRQKQYEYYRDLLLSFSKPESGTA
jgi:type I restriction enzyme S subunit